MVEWEVARQCVLLRDINDEEAKRLLSIGVKRSYRRGDFLLKQGAPASHIFVILSGMVQVRRKQGNREITIVHLGAGQLVGEMALVSSGVHSASVEVVETPTEVLAFEVEKVRALCEAEPMLGYRLMRNIASDLAFKIHHNNLNLLV